METESYIGEHRGWFPNLHPSAGVLLAWVQGCILVAWTVSSLADSCVDQQLMWEGPRGIQLFESGRRVVAECGKQRIGGPPAQPASTAHKTSPSSLNYEPLLSFSLLERMEANSFLLLLGGTWVGQLPCQLLPYAPNTQPPLPNLHPELGLGTED